MNVLIIIQNMSYTYDTRIHHVVNALRNENFNISIISPRYIEDPLYFKKDCVEIWHYPLPKTSDGFFGHLIEYGYAILAISFLTALVCLRRNIRIVHICNPPDIFFSLFWILRLFGKRIIFDLHDACPELMATRFSICSTFFIGLVRNCESLSCHAANLVLTTNNQTRNKVILRTGIPASKALVVRNAPDLSQLPIEGDFQRREKYVRVCYIGNINIQDGLEYLLRAAHHIRYKLQRKDIKFFCVGDGGDYLRIRRLAKDLNLLTTIHFFGRLKHSDAMRILARCDIATQPDPKNDFNDSCTMVKSLECMALGKPLVAFELLETYEICADAALYAEPNSFAAFAEKIVALADDPALRRRLGSTGRHRISTSLNWQLEKKALLQAYAKLGATELGVET